MKNVFIATSRVVAFREALGVVEDTEKGQPGFMVAWGEAGRGKTECAKQYAIDHENTKYIRVFEGWTPKAMLVGLCEELNGITKIGTVERAKRIVIEELDDVHRTLLIDEADRLDIRNIEHLRDIHDATGCPIVLIGEPSIYSQIRARARIWQRVTRVVDFGPVETDDIVTFGVKAAGLDISAEAAVLLVKKCEGSFRLLYHIMVELERIAKANKTDKITSEFVNGMPNRRPAPSRERTR